MIRTQGRPSIPPEKVADLVHRHYGLSGVMRPLPGERDLNFALEGEGGRLHVVKVTSPDEPDAQLTFETALLDSLANAPGVPVPALVRSMGGDAVVRHADEAEGDLRIRVLEYLPGRILAGARPRGPHLLEKLGRCIARLSDHLAEQKVAPPRREGFVWALAEAGSVMTHGLALLADDRQRALVEGCLAGFLAVEPTTSALPSQLIHGDLNDHNLLVEGVSPETHDITGILDFGDAHRAPPVFDLAIALAYAVLGAPDPVESAADVVRGYHAVRALTEVELDVLFPLVRARLGASVSISASRRSGATDVDEYLLVSEAPAWNALAATADVHPRIVRGFLRQACGMEPCPRSAAIVGWLGRVPGVVPVMSMPEIDTKVLDLSVGSPDLDGHDTDDTRAFTRRTFDAIRGTGALVGIGRYLEPRGFYLSEAFAGRASELPERRTVHMGIDVFDQPGAEVRAPLGGMVRSVADNTARLDYGPTVILEHPTPDGPFWTLYGHLERDSVSHLVEGDQITAGQSFARVGPPPENGDWPPHLHFQIITDLLDRKGDFPGVAAPREVGVWKSFSPDPNLLLRLELPTTWQEPRDLRERRAELLGPSLSLSYHQPIHVVRGRGPYLYDVFGREYLDCVNNVAHVGHEHPRVVSAGQRQMAVLNTNTRYLHEGILEYAERLGRLFPDPLGVCFFVNSGSEANELALRMARTVTGGTGVVALEGGYHGNTQGLIDVSHYKFSRKGGAGAPHWVRAAAMPDEFRGRYRRDDPQRAQRYAAHVSEALRELTAAGFPPAAFLAEPMLSCGGQVELPEGYLERVYASTRAVGALCIADEVQIGFGRMGSHRWGFETHGVVPDIVTLGKPIGNGHPLGAVVTTRDIAARFANGMEFFSTFGGNPVSCAIGMAVLDVLEDEGLQAHAHAVGQTFKDGLTELISRHEIIGDVRGRGLFLGVELVSRREDPAPAEAAARYVVTRMRERGILLSTDGPDDNVVKIKPPLPFSAADAERVVGEMDRVLSEDFVRLGAYARQ